MKRFSLLLGCLMAASVLFATSAFATTRYAAQSGTTFDHVEIDNTAKPAVQKSATALVLGPGTDVSIRSSVISGFHCIEAPGTGTLEIDDSTINATAASTCLLLGPNSHLRRSTVQLPEAVISPALPPPLVATTGLVEDTSVTGGPPQ